jgi:hypothetical protein
METGKKKSCNCSNIIVLAVPVVLTLKVNKNCNANMLMDIGRKSVAIRAILQF